MNKEGGSTLTIRKSNHVTDGFKGYKATLFAGEMSYTEINIPLRKGDDLFLHGNKDAGCIGYFSGSEVLLFGCYGLFARDDDSRYLLTKERSSCDFPSYLSFPHGLLEMKRGYSSCPVIFYIQKVNAQS